MSPTAIGLLAIFLFSTGTLLISLSGDLPPFQLSSIICLSCAFSLWIYFKIRGKPIRDKLNAPIAHYATIIFGIGLYQPMANIAFKIAPPFEMNMINYLWPILLVLFLKGFQKQKLKVNEFIGMTCGFIGVCFIFMPQDGTMLGHIGIGHVLMLIGAIIWALYSAIIRLQDVSVALLIPCTLLSGTVYLIIHLLFEETVVTLPLSASVATIILCFTCCSYGLWDHGMRKGDQMLLTSLSYFLPLLSASYFIIFGLVPARPEVAIGGGLIITGCLIVNAHRMKFLKRKLNETL